MRVLLSWLREFADLPDSATEVALQLTRGGIEVEERRDFSGARLHPAPHMSCFCHTTDISCLLLFY